MDISKIKIKHALRIILGIIFIFSALGKLVGPSVFLNEVGKISFLPASSDVFIGYAFILFECILGFLIIFHCNKATLLVTAILVLLFTLYLGYKVVTHDSSDCGCFGVFLCVFRPKVATCSGESCHPFRFNAATYSGLMLPPGF